MINIVQASFAYPAAPVLFENLSCRVESGTILSVLGPNGAGKTSLLKCILGFLTPVSGQVEFTGLGRPGSRDFWGQVAYVPQAGHVTFTYTVRDMVLMGRSASIGLLGTPGEKDRRLAGDALERTGIADLADRPVNRISGGQLQLTLIARALVKNPKVIILDEPESSLDMKNQLIILDLLEKLCREKGVTIVINTHYPDHALRISHQTIILGNGLSHICGPTRDVITSENILLFFDVENEVVEYKRNEETHRRIFPLRCRETEQH